MCIVVVDDEVELLGLIRDLLEDEGYEVESFAHPAPVARLADTEIHPDLFLIDLMLPQMTGLELAEQLQNEGFGAIPMIALSASTDYVEEARESGFFDAAITKPFDLDDLLSAIEQHLARSAATP